MTVLYYTQTYYLDAVLELIQSLKAIADVHLLIEVSPESRKSTVVDIPSLKDFSPVELAENVIGNKNWPLMAKYVDQLSSVHFIVFQDKRSISLSTVRTCHHALKLIRSIKPDVVHLDTVSVRSLGFFPFFSRQKLVITVHDPVFHSGEHSWKSDFVRRLFFWKTNKLLFYSAFAAQQFYINYPHVRVPGFLLKFQPFGYTKNLVSSIDTNGEFILFFGRLSLYKGIDMLIDAIPGVLKKYPYERFVIAGRAENYTVDSSILEHYEGSIDILYNYFSSDELAKLIQRAKFIVCPYRDATQSGVLMTAFAFGKTVVATNVGAFPEYIEDNFNGLLALPNAEDIQTKILKALSGSTYLKLQKNIQADSSSVVDAYNQDVLKHTYSFN